MMELIQKIENEIAAVPDSLDIIEVQRCLKLLANHVALLPAPRQMQFLAELIEKGTVGADSLEA